MSIIYFYFIKLDFESKERWPNSLIDDQSFLFPAVQSVKLFVAYVSGLWRIKLIGQIIKPRIIITSETIQEPVKV